VNYYRREAYHGRYVYKGYAKKLTPENVSKIKSQLHIKTCSQLAREYGVYPSTIEAINKNRIWRHVS
jgi:hypothetical protein